MNISIAMCTYNGSRYLVEQLHSIANQTCQPIELVIFDDGSSDETKQIVSAFQSTVGFLVHFHENASTLGSTKNFEQAIRHCTGDLIALCDQDDVWFPEKLALMSAALEAEAGLAGVFSNARLIDESGRLLPNDLWHKAGFTAERQRKFRKELAPYDLIGHDTVTGAAFMFRSSFVPQVLPISSEWIHDGWIALILASLAELRPIPEYLMSYRLHTSQQVGVRQVPWYNHLSTRKRDALLSHQHLARRFMVMAGRLEVLGIDTKITTELRRRAAYLERRAAALSQTPLSRILPVLRLFPDYFRYHNGVISLLRDLFH